MEFSLICPNDGPIELGLESVTTIVLRGLEQADIIFVCPHCGEQIQVSIRIPDLFVSAVAFDMVSDAPEDEEDEFFDLIPPRRRRQPVPAPPTPAEQRRIDRYCEYFRRQLAGTADVDAVLAEIDSASG